MMTDRTTTYPRFGSKRKVSEREKPEETLTEEELEILGQVLDNLVAGELGSGPASDPEEKDSVEEASEEGKILLALSSGDDRNLLEEICGEFENEVLHIRNRYCVLDELRRRPIRLVVTDLCLWGDRGTLLFERMDGGASQVPVIFIREQGEELSDKARDAIACGILERPLQPDDVKTLVRSALGGLVDEGPVDEGPVDEGPVDEGAGGREEDEQESPGGSRQHLRHWLPFFFDARKSLRTSDYKGRRFRLVLRLLNDHLSPEAAFLLERDSEGTRLQAFTETDRDAVDTDHLLARIRETLEKDQLVGHGANGELAFKLPARGGCRRLVYIEFGSQLLEWETEYLDELLHLLAEEV